MDPKRKKLYIVAIVICLVASVGVLWWGGILGPSGSSDVDTAPLLPVTTGAPKAKVDGSFQPPTVFPNNPKLDMSVFDLSAFKSLNLYTSPAVPESEIGREDPFKTY